MPDWRPKVESYGIVISVALALAYSLHKCGMW